MREPPGRLSMTSPPVPSRSPSQSPSPSGWPVGSAVSFSAPPSSPTISGASAWTRRIGRWPSICLPINPLANQSACQSACLPINLLANQPACQPTRVPTNPRANESAALPTSYYAQSRLKPRPLHPLHPLQSRRSHYRFTRRYEQATYLRATAAQAHREQSRQAVRALLGRVNGVNPGRQPQQGGAEALV